MVIKLKVPYESVKRNADYFGIAGYLTSLHGVSNVFSKHFDRMTEQFDVYLEDHEDRVVEHIKSIAEQRGWEMETDNG